MIAQVIGTNILDVHTESFPRTKGVYEVLVTIGEGSFINNEDFDASISSKRTSILKYYYWQKENQDSDDNYCTTIY